MRKKILMLSSSQFGYLTDALKLCEYAKDEFDITYIGWDYNKPRVEVEGIDVRYISRHSNVAMRNIRLLRAFHLEIQNGYDLVFANYKFGISIIKLLNRKSNFLIDIRTLSVSYSGVKRAVNDAFLKFEILFFDNISVVSVGIAQLLKLKKYHHLPVGGECFTSEPKSFQKLSFLYVGTLDNRNIIDCVKGFHLFIKGLKPTEPAPVFTIVGDGPGNELQEIKDYVKNNNLGENVIIMGEIAHNKLHGFFENANVGISYIPLCPYYEYQPSTKTFEYLISGIPVLGTYTYENKKVVTENAGVLVEDNAVSFSDGIRKIYERKDSFNSALLMKTFNEYTWKRLVKEKYITVINQLC